MHRNSVPEFHTPFCASALRQGLHCERLFLWYNESILTERGVFLVTAALDPGTADKVLALTKNIVKERNITCLMVTHNMNQALELGNRTLMMDAGHIVFDVSGEERAKLTVEDLLEKFSVGAGKAFDNDRILLSTVAEEK